MAAKLFILGCSGSGKSTAAHHVVKRAQDKGYSAIHVNDYEILYKMFQADEEAKGGKFRLTAYDGFDVRDHAVYDEALKQLEQEVEGLRRQTEGLIIVEFARNDYRLAFKLFSVGFLKDASFLLLESSPDICIQRIHERATHPATRDDHFVPDYIIETYNHKGNRQYIISGLKTEYGIPNERLKIIDNRGASMSFFKEVARFAEEILRREIDVSKATEQLPKVSTSTPINESDQETHSKQETEPIRIVTPIDEPKEP